MTVRIPLADHTQRTLDDLYDQLARAQRVACDHLDNGPITRVRNELDRITRIPLIANNSDRADSFDCGARWTIRMIRTALNAPAPDSPPIVGLWVPERPPHQDGAECPCPSSCGCCKPEPAPVLRDPCPRCEGSPTRIPRDQRAGHMREHHPEEQPGA